GVLVVAAVVRIVLFVVAVRHPGRFWSPDDREYLPLAHHLHAAYLTSGPGRLFVLGLRRPPIYPLVLRGIFDVFGNHYAAVVAVQLLLGVVTVALTFRLAKAALAD